MKKTLLLISAALLATTAAIAQEPTAKKSDEPTPKKIDAKLEALIQEALPVCGSDAKVTYYDMVHKMPANLTGTVVRVQSPRVSCEGQSLAVVSREGGFYFGFPWFLDDEKGTIEEKLKDFSWTKMQNNVTPIVDRTKTREGLYKVTLVQTTESGKMPLEGEIDPDGKIFFLGHFRPMTVSAPTARLKAFEPFVATAPTTGAAKPVVTVIEFSDFECPSCRFAADYMKPILDKHADKVRYVRYDLPLVTMHPWAFSAAVAGRAIWNQKPELFWDYKHMVYSNQEKLNAFTLADVVRGWAQDHDLDMKKYDTDVDSAALKDEMMKSVAVAFANDIRATPTYVVNGMIVDAGKDGKGLEEYVVSLLK